MTKKIYLPTLNLCSDLLNSIDIHHSESEFNTMTKIQYVIHVHNR